MVVGVCVCVPLFLGRRKRPTRKSMRFYYRSQSLREGPVRLSNTMFLGEEGRRDQQLSLSRSIRNVDVERFSRERG